MPKLKVSIATDAARRVCSRCLKQPATVVLIERQAVKLRGIPPHTARRPLCHTCGQFLTRSKPPAGRSRKLV